MVAARRRKAIAHTSGRKGGGWGVMWMCTQSIVNIQFKWSTTEVHGSRVVAIVIQGDEKVNVR